MNKTCPWFDTPAQDSNLGSLSGESEAPATVLRLRRILSVVLSPLSPVLLKQLLIMDKVYL